MVEQKILFFLGRIGRRFFCFLSRWEDQGHLPALTKWLKICVLGVIVAVIAACGKKVVNEPQIMCYRAPAQPDAMVSDITVFPNPTEGADSITLTATAKVTYPYLDSNFISSARCWVRDIEMDLLDMIPADSLFDDSLEVLKARLSVEGLQPGTTWVGIRLETSLSGWGWDSNHLIITDGQD